MLKKIILLISLPLVLAGCSQTVGFVNVNVDSAANNNQSGAAAVSTTNLAATPTDQVQKSTKSVTSASSSSAVNKISIKIPAQLVLPVLFAQQAPFGNWDAVHEEACEEASMIMAAKYFFRQPLDETIMEQELQKVLKWETDNNYNVDLTASQTAVILKQYYGLQATVSAEVTADRIKYELASGHLLIIPASGRDLPNPNFKQPGPLYHMLVIKGYDSQDFITNDPGTRKGNGFRYTYSGLLNAVHDWNDQVAQDRTVESMRQGRQVMIVVNN